MAVQTKDFERTGAACRVWLSGAPSFQGLKTAAVGRFSCEAAASGQALLTEVFAALGREGFQYLVGPMDGTTWQSYRFVIESDGSPPFVLEPQNPPQDPAAFLAAGFQSIASYASARATDFQPRGTAGYAKRLARAGISVRPLDISQPEAELAKMYDLALETFARNFLYTPISREGFFALYQPVLAKLDPEHVLMAEGADRTLQAFLFAIPDWAQGSRPDQLIIKTYASRYPGLGGYLAEEIHTRAAAAGFRAVIHALMHQDNPSKRNSEKYGRTFRRYALFGREIGR